MGSCWLRKKSSLSDSHKNEAQGKRNLDVKDVVEGYQTPEETNESRITKKRSFNSSCPNNPLQEFSRGRSFTFKPKMTALGFEHSAIQSFKSQGLEVESRVRLANLKLALWEFDYGFTSGFMDGGPKALHEVYNASLDLFLGSLGYKGKTELVRITIRIYAVGEKAVALPSAPGVSAFNEIEKEKYFIHKKGITKKKPITPKADLLAWYIDTTTSRCLRKYGT
jgi:hypothetical protein